MRKFIVKVEGKRYEVEVEEVDVKAQTTTLAGGSEPVAEPKLAQPKAQAPVAPQPKPQAKQEHIPEPQVETTGGFTVEAPMPGAVLDVKVKVGDQVKQGDVLLILESMKMENEITSPFAGKVAEVKVSKGSSVNTGDPMIVLS